MGNSLTAQHRHRRPDPQQALRFNHGRRATSRLTRRDNTRISLNAILRDNGEDHQTWPIDGPGGALRHRRNRGRQVIVGRVVVTPTHPMMGQSSSSCSAGSRTTIRAPTALSATTTDPPWAVTTSPTMANPSPAPPAGRSRAWSTRVKRSKTRSRSSTGIPGRRRPPPLRHTLPCGPPRTTPSWRHAALRCQKCCEGRGRAALGHRARGLPPPPADPRRPAPGPGAVPFRQCQLVEVHRLVAGDQLALVAPGQQQQVVDDVAEAAASASAVAATDGQSALSGTLVPLRAQ